MKLPRVTHSLKLIPLFSVLALSFACGTSQKNPSRFMDRAFEAKRDSARHLQALNKLCTLESSAEPPRHEFCLEAIRLQEMTGDQEGAMKRASDFCQKGSAEACLIWTRQASKEDARLARETLSRACSEDAAYCLYSGRLEFRLGNAAEALKRARRGCAAGHAVACRDQGLISIHQDDLSEAAVALEKACQADVESACFEKALVTRMMGKSNPEQIELLCKAQAHPLACDLQEVDTLKTLEKDWATRADRTCRKQGGEICYRSALDQYFRPGGKSLAKFKFRNYCNDTPEGAKSCYMKLFVSRPFGFEAEDEAELKKLCGLEAKTACFELGRTQPQATVAVSKVAEEDLVSSCEIDQRPESCEEKARRLFESGDRVGAERFMLKACDIGAEDACAWLGTRVLEQNPPDPARASDFFRKACLAGSALGCERLLTQKTDEAKSVN